MRTRDDREQVNRLCAQVLMGAGAHPAMSTCLVEGQADLRALDGCLSDQECRVIPADGKRVAIRVVRELARRRHRGHAAVVDRDYDQLLGRSAEDNVLWTDVHDMELLILRCSGAIDRFLAEFPPLKGLLGVGQLAVERLLEAVRPLGCLRLSSEERHWHLSFKGTNLTSNDRSLLAVPVPALVTEIIELNPTCPVNNTRLLEAVSEKMNAGADPWFLCCGHDVTSLLAGLVRRETGISLLPIHVESYLRAGFDRARFKETALAEQMREWEAKHAPYRLLHADLR